LLLNPVLDSQSTTYATIWQSTLVVLAHMCHMNPTALGTLMDNEFLDQVEEDLNDNSNEPATRGDVRNLALRVELRFTKLESSIDQRFTKLESSIDQRFTKLESSIDQRFMAIDNRFTTFDASIKDYVYKLGWKFFGATIGTMGAMFTVFGIFINSSMK
jgi:hypothetical protein